MQPAPPYSCFAGPSPPLFAHSRANRRAAIARATPSCSAPATLAITGPKKPSSISSGSSSSDDNVETQEADGEEEEDDTFQRGQPLAIILEPEEMRVWRQAKEKIGYVRDKAALLKLANDYLNPPEAAQQ